MIYERIKALADKKGMSISALEKASGLGNATIRMWKTSAPRVDNLQAVANVLGVSVDSILKK